MKTVKIELNETELLILMDAIQHEAQLIDDLPDDIAVLGNNMHDLANK